VRAHKEQNDVGSLNPIVNPGSPLVTRRDHPIVPLHDLTHALTYYELTPNFVHERFIFMRI